VGKLNIQQLGWGGATKGVGTVAISNPGSGYQLFDIITLTGSLPTGQLAQAQITAVKAVGITIVNGGENYAVGDQLLYKYGTGTQTLIVQVTQIKNQAGLRGVIDQLAIVSTGYYTDLSVGIDDWYTAGLGTQATLTPVWGAAQVFMLERGIYAQDPQVLTQLSVIAAGGGSSEGENIQLNMTPAHVQQQVTLQGDGVTSTIRLNNPANVGTVWVTLNGATTFNWGVDSADPRTLVLGFVPEVGDVVIVSVFSSSLFSLKRVQTLELDLPTLTYDLQYAPQYSVAQGLNSQVFVNGTLIRGPVYRRFQADGVQTLWDLNTVVSDPATMVTVWVDSQLQDPRNYSFPTTTQIEFSVEYTPALTSDILIQIVDTVTPTLDYVIDGEQIVFQPGVITGTDQVQVITFSEDSSVKWAQDRFTGTSPAVYVLSIMPTDFGAVQVYVDGVKQSEVWDYMFVQVANQVQVQFHSPHTMINMVTVYYVVSDPVKPPVAFRMFENIYGDTQFYRLSDLRCTQLTDTITWQDDQIWVQDGTKLPVASTQHPGVIWADSERIEYTVAEADANESFPNRVKLSGLRRGSMGTSTGIFTDVVTEFHNGDGETTLYATALSNPIVKVNGTEQIEGVHYDIVQDPPSVVAGTYIQFIQTGQINNVPPPGDRNVCVIQIINGVSTGNISHISGTWVRDASANEQIPAGYIWPYGDRGIQYSAEPQTAFLIAEPGTRRR
jgi:hypothetical protein